VKVCTSRTLLETQLYSLSSLTYSLNILYLQPPIHLFGIDGRYAHAVYSAAAKQKQLEKVEEELNNVDVSFLKLFSTSVLKY
jgi:F-type H+-transporting ATPase subunit O